MTVPGTLGERLDALCAEAAYSLGHEGAVGAITAIRNRLHEPLRVAVAGRVKAGKSTLLNALVGERLAPTDAGECTRIVSWYRHFRGYDVSAVLHDGSRRPVAFHRREGALVIELDDAAVAGVERLEIGWPSSRLEHLTLIDTPGIGSTDDLAGERTAAFFALDQDHPADADAVVYLMRHAHHTDAEFLDSFLDRSITNATPVNAVGVLSRADEVGAGRLDALESAARIAARYGNDERLQPLISGVVAVAGLLAETGATLEEREAAALRNLAAESEPVREEMLLSVDQFLDTGASDLTRESREELLLRLGMFGVRYGIELIRAGRASSATELSRAFIDASGVGQLRSLVEGQFAARAHLLQARSALSSLRAVARDLEAGEPDRAAQLGAALEAVESSAHELAELRLLHMLRVGAVAFTPAEAAEAELLVGPGNPAEKLGLTPDAGPAQVREQALAAVARWRQRAESPLADRSTAYGAGVMARSYEGIYAAHLA